MSMKRNVTAKKGDQDPVSPGYPTIKRGVADTSCPSSGNYPTRVSKKNQNEGLKESKKVGKIKRFLKKVPREIFDVLSVFLLAVSCMLLLTVFNIYIQQSMKSGSPWIVKYPTYEQFDHFAIASTSEHCNEYARQFFIEEHDFLEISLMMTICLAHFEPQSSSIFGGSTLLYASINSSKETNCWQSAGRLGPSLNLSSYLQYRALSPISEFIGFNAMAIPSDISTILSIALAMNESYPNEWKGKFSKVYDKLNIEFRALSVPASARLIEAANHPIIEQAMYARRYMDSFNVKREGNVFKKKWKEVEIDLLHDILTLNWAKLPKEIDYISVFREISREDREQFLHNFAYYIAQSNNTHKLNVNKKTVKGGQQMYHICGPSLVSRDHDYVMKSLTAEALSNMKTSQSDNQRLRESPDHFVRLNFGMKQAFKEIKFYKNEKLNRIGKMMVDLYRQLNRSLQYKYTAPIQPNGFVMVNHKTNEAVAYGATLGSAFGSLVLDEKLQFVNNLASLGYYADTYFYLEPIIITSDAGKIEAVYLDLADSHKGYPSLARKISSLSLKLFESIGLPEAVNWVLAYEDPFENKKMVDAGMPWHRKEEVFKRFNTLDTGILQTSDGVLAIDYKTVIHFVNNNKTVNQYQNGEQSWKAVMGR